MVVVTARGGAKEKVGGGGRERRERGRVGKEAWWLNPYFRVNAVCQAECTQVTSV